MASQNGGIVKASFAILRDGTHASTHIFTFSPFPISHTRPFLSTSLPFRIFFHLHELLCVPFTVKKDDV